MSNNSDTYKNYLKSQHTPAEKDILEQIDFSKIILVLKRSLIWVILFFTLGIGGARLYLRYTPPLYKSTSSIKIKLENEAKEVNLVRGRNNVENTDLSGEVELIRSKIVFDQVIKDLNLWVSYYSEGRVLDEEKYPHGIFQISNYDVIKPAIENKKISLTLTDKKTVNVSYQLGKKTFEKDFNINQRIKTEHIHFDIDFNHIEGHEDRLLYFKVHNKPNLYGYLNSNLTIFPNERSQTINISFQDYNRVKAQSIVQKIDSLYLQLTLEDKQKKNEQSIKYIEGQLDKTGNELSKYEVIWEDFSKENTSINIERDQTYYLTELRRLDVEKGYAYDKLNTLLTMQRNINKDSVKVNMQYLSYIDDAKLSQLSDELYEEYNGLKRLKKMTGESSTVVKLRIKKYNELKEKAQKLVDDLIISEEKWISDIQSKQKKILVKLDQFPHKATIESQIGRQFRLYEKFYQMLQEKKLEYEIARAGIVQEFKILSPASMPIEPISPVRSMIYIYGIFLALTLSLILIVIRYLLHNTLITQSDFERLTAVPNLGVVPKYKRKMDVSQLVVHQNPKSSISEAFRSLRTNLEFLSSSEGKKIFSVTSTISGEGKTFISTNLSAIIALSGKKVVLLDLDMRKPKVHLAFGMENNEGMSTILIGKSTYKQSLQHTEVPGLDFISAGPIPPNPSELILRNSFNELLRDLHKEYDIIIIDTPPTGLVTDGVLIMKKVDVPIYVTRSQYTKKGFEKNLNALYTQKEFSKLCYVINGMSEIGSYGYGYGYGYGNYYEEEETKPFFKRIFSKD